MAERIVQLVFDDGTKLLAEVAGPPAHGQQLSGGVSEKLTANFDVVAKAVQKLATQMKGALEAAAPTTTELSFGLDLHAESELLPMIVSGDAKASMKIVLRWERKGTA